VMRPRSETAVQLMQSQFLLCGVLLKFGGEHESYLTKRMQSQFSLRSITVAFRVKVKVSVDIRNSRNLQKSFSFQEDCSENAKTIR
jgi:hypothetical protein